MPICVCQSVVPHHAEEHDAELVVQQRVVVTELLRGPQEVVGQRRVVGPHVLHAHVQVGQVRRRQARRRAIRRHGLNTPATVHQHPRCKAPIETKRLNQERPTWSLSSCAANALPNPIQAGAKRGSILVALWKYLLGRGHPNLVNGVSHFQGLPLNSPLAR